MYILCAGMITNVLLEGMIPVRNYCCNVDTKNVLRHCSLHRYVDKLAYLHAIHGVKAITCKATVKDFTVMDKIKTRMSGYNRKF